MTKRQTAVAHGLQRGAVRAVVDRCRRWSCSSLGHRAGLGGRLLDLSGAPTSSPRSAAAWPTSPPTCCSSTAPSSSMTGQRAARRLLRKDRAFEVVSSVALLALAPLVCLAVERGAAFLPLLLPPLLAVYAVGVGLAGARAAGAHRRADPAAQPHPAAPAHRRRARAGATSRCCCSTSTASRRSTTRSATTSATGCCRWSPRGSPRAGGLRHRGPPRRRRVRPRAARHRASEAARATAERLLAPCPSRSCSRACCSTSARARASRSRRSTATTSTRCSSTRTSRCTWPRSPARLEVYDPARTATAPAACRCSASCAGPSTVGSWSCTTSRRLALANGTRGRRRGARALAAPGARPAPAGRFIPLAERTGLVPAAHLLRARRRAGAAGRWHAPGPGLSARREHQRQATCAARRSPGEVERGLERHGVPAGRAAPGGHRELAARRPGARRRPPSAGSHELGVTLSLDDFGTGYASLVPPAPAAGPATSSSTARSWTGCPTPARPRRGPQRRRPRPRPRHAGRGRGRRGPRWPSTPAPRRWAATSRRAGSSRAPCRPPELTPWLRDRMSGRAAPGLTPPATPPSVGDGGGDARQVRQAQPPRVAEARAAGPTEQHDAVRASHGRRGQLGAQHLPPLGHPVALGVQRRPPA